MNSHSKNPCRVCGFAFKNWRHSQNFDGGPDDQYRHEFRATEKEAAKWIVLYVTGEPDSEILDCVGPFDSESAAHGFANRNPKKYPESSAYLFTEVVTMRGPAKS